MYGLYELHNVTQFLCSCGVCGSAQYVEIRCLFCSRGAKKGTATFAKGLTDREPGVSGPSEGAVTVGLHIR